MVTAKSSGGAAAWLLASLVVSIAPGCGGPAPESAAAAGSSQPASRRSGALTPIDPHQLHKSSAGAQCNDCHCTVGECGPVGVKLLSFAPIATAPGLPGPRYDIASQTCTNVACHMVPAGTFVYSACGVDAQATLERASYGGTPVTTPPWYSAVSGGCVSCHDNPPDARTKTWHSGLHGNDAAMNECSFCHPDVTSSGGVLALSAATNCGPGGTFGSCAALHRNGTVEVAPRWRSICFGCH